MIIGPQKQIKFDSKCFLLLKKLSFSDRKSTAIFPGICIKQDQISTSHQRIFHKNRLCIGQLIFSVNPNNKIICTQDSMGKIMSNQCFYKILFIGRPFTALLLGCIHSTFYEYLDHLISISSFIKCLN